ncbi:MAG TPA: hypothetical protein VNO56_01530 [Gaiellaceae bacterium]|nr:hypothetical protein [Gaiellaceae bacterium]
MLTLLGFLAFGAVASNVLRRWDVARGLVCDLAVALRPLSLPLLVLVLVAAARALPLGLALGVFVLGVFIAARFVILPEWGTVVRVHKLVGSLFDQQHIPAPGITPFGQISPVSLLRTFQLVVVPGLVVVAFVSPSFWLGGRGGWVTAFAEGGIIVVGLALLARLTGFSRKPLRALCAFLLCLLAARSLVLAGFIPGESLLRDLPGWQVLSPRKIAMALGAALLLCAIVESLAARAGPGRRTWLRRLDTTWTGDRVANGAAAVGFLWSFVAALALTISVFWGVYVISHAQGSASGGVQARALSDLENGASLRPDALTDEELAKAYMPVFVYAEHQSWLPTAVDSYLDGATLVSRHGERQPAPESVSSLPSTCGADVSPPCYRLTIKCESADRGCSEGQSLPESDTLDRGRSVYARVVRADTRLRRTPQSRATEAVLAYPGPLDAPVRTLLQYWLFYRYDEWAAPTMLGRLVQRHEADWESITIGFSATEPLFVAYSAHCGGRWLEWDDIQVADDPSLSSATHPLVAVAEGSHANYDDSHSRRPPDWATCLGMEGSAFEALTYVWGIEDVTGDHYRLLPTDVRMVDGGDPPMSFPGTWGGNDHTTLRNARSFQIGQEGAGPKTPSLQALWIDPITTIFCSEQWRPRRCDKGIRPPADRGLIAVLDEL